MRAPHLILYLIFLLATFTTKILAANRLAVIQNSTAYPDPSNRRILHQPLFPESSAPPPDAGTSPPPPPPDNSALPTPEQPFFHELPTGPSTDQSPPPPPAPANGNAQIPTATQPTKQTKTVAIAISVGIVTLGMLSALVFFLYRHGVKHRSETQKLVGGGGGNSQRLPEDSRAPPSSFLYIGTVEPSRTSFSEANGVVANREAPNRSPYRKLNSIKRSDRYRPSPELQPLPPLAKPPNVNSPSAMSSEEDEESQETAFHSPQGSTISYEESYYTPISRQSNNSNNHLPINNCAPIPARTEIALAPNASVPHSKRTSPKSRFSVSSTTTQQAAAAAPPPPPPPPPPMSNGPPSTALHDDEQAPPPYPLKRPKFSAPPPAPNMARLHSPKHKSGIGVPPPPPPPPPPMQPQRVGVPETIIPVMRSQLPTKPQSWTSIPKTGAENGMVKPVQQTVNKAASSSENFEGDDSGGPKPKLKPLHWDKVRATSDRATVWDQLKSSSFQ